MPDSPSIRRRNHKWAMVSHKGGHCYWCGLRVTAGNIELFEFDHKIQINRPSDKTDRWSGDIRDWPPFTDKWYVWAQGVDLVCHDCHERRHRPRKQLSMLEFLNVQARLDGHVGSVMRHQAELFIGLFICFPCLSFYL